MSTTAIALTRTMRRASRPAPTVFVTHADRFLRATLETTISDANWPSRSFSDAETLLSQLHAAGPACLVADVRLLDVDGLESMLAERRDIPVIFIADNPSARTVVRAMK